MFSSIIKMFKFLFIGVPLIVAGAVILFLILIHIRGKKIQGRNMSIYSYIKGLDNFTANRIYIDVLSRSVIAFSKDKRSILRAEFYLNEQENPVINSPKYFKIYNLHEVISADLIEDAATKTSTTGYTMFDDQWIFAKSTSEKEIQKLEVKVMFNDSRSPSFYIALYETMFSSRDYNSSRTGRKVFLNIAQDLLTDLNYLMHKSKEEKEAAKKPKPIPPSVKVIPTAPNASNPVKSAKANRMPQQKRKIRVSRSVIEDIERISRLKAQGLITEEEFTLLKAKLIRGASPPKA